MNPSKQQQMEAEADRMIQALQTEDTEHKPEDGAEVNTEMVEQNADQGATSTESVAPSAPVIDNGELTRLKAELEKSEQRYRTLTGMIEKRNSENDSLRALVAQLTQSVEQLKMQHQQAPAAPLVGKADEDAFGSDLIDVMRRVAEEIATSKLAESQSKFGADIEKLNQQVNTVADVTVKSAVERFEDKLTGIVPDWRSINLDSGFIDWLNEYGMMDALNGAYSNMDLERTAKYFTGYKKFTGAEQAPAPAKPAANVNEYVAPGKSKATPPRQEGPTGKVWSPAAVTELYTDLRTGKISQSKFDELEADMFRSQSEGRFVTA